MQHLGRLLLVGYGLAAIAAVAVHEAGGGSLSAILVFWVGGAVVVGGLALAVAPMLPSRPEAAATDSADALAEALRQWEEDRLGDQTAAAEARRDGTRRS